MFPSRMRKSQLLLLVLVVTFAARLLQTAHEKSFTVDEPHYIGTALYLWETGDYHFWRATRLHPPLAFHIAGLPLLALDLGELPVGPNLGLYFVNRPHPAVDQLRVLTRIPFILLACWGAVLAFLWAREASGDAAGLLAALLYTLSPTLLANGGIVHSDITVTVFYLQTLYAFWRWCRRPTLGRLALCGASLGLALISKHSALLLLPTLAALLAGIALGRPQLLEEESRLGPAGRMARLWWALGMFLGMLAVSIGVLWLGYGGSFAVVEAGGRTAPSYLQSLLWFDQANDLGRMAFLFGEFSPRGWWYFFPVVFVMKTPIGMLGLIALAGIARWRGIRPAETVLLVSILLYSFVACFVWKIPMGLRYVLPTLPLLHIWVGIRLAALTSTWRRIPIAICCVWLGIASLWIHPHYLAYFNELAGGPRQGYRHLVGSDLDWGQDLGSLARELEARGNPPLWLAYFGLEKPEHYGLRAKPLVGCEPVDGLVAISASVLQRMYAPPGSHLPAPEGCYAWLLAQKPVAYIGYSILLYDVTDP